MEAEIFQASTGTTQMCLAPFSLWRLPPSGHVRPSSTEHSESVLTGKQESRGCFLRRNYQVLTAYSLPYHEFSQGSNRAPPSAYDVPKDDCLPFYKPPKLLIQSFKKKKNSFICVVWLGLIYLIQDTLQFLTVSKYPISGVIRRALQELICCILMTTQQFLRWGPKNKI